MQIELPISGEEKPVTEEEPKDTEIQTLQNTNNPNKDMYTNTNRDTQILTILGRDQQIHFVSSLIRPHLDAYSDDNNSDDDDYDDGDDDDGDYDDDDDVCNNGNNDDVADCPALSFVHFC